MTPVSGHFDVTGDSRFGPAPPSSAAVLGEDGDGSPGTAARVCKAQKEISDVESSEERRASLRLCDAYQQAQFGHIGF
ncbi:hypothetical protein NL676_019017 [Syzygium grande]|nr:hypothetical protein NL676_019017 [Syzygium grande]